MKILHKLYYGEQLTPKPTPNGSIADVQAGLQPQKPRNSLLPGTLGSRILDLELSMKSQAEAVELLSLYSVSQS